MRIIFPCTARPHLVRQKLLIEQLRKYFDIDIWTPRTKQGGSLATYSIMVSVEFNNFLNRRKADAVIIRGDRMELLPLAALCAYREIPVIHLEAGDVSGVIDNKIRHAVSQLSDYHFPTNDEARVRLIGMGCHPDKVFNYGSLDVEVAQKVRRRRVRSGKYILVAYHPIKGEDESEVSAALEAFSAYDVVSVVSNQDYGKQYGSESFSPDDYINLLRGASCIVGNSSSILKEASIFPVGVVNVGSRQRGRLRPRQVMDSACKKENIMAAVSFQLGQRYEIDSPYAQPDTSKRIAKKMSEIL